MDLPRSFGIFGLLAMGMPMMSAADLVPDFSREILPILSDNCFQCHGPDANHREADLRLDLESNAKAPRDSYNIIDPGNSAGSELVYHITTDDEMDRMPPLDSIKSLSDDEKNLLTRWIDSGAEWGQHWSFDPIMRPAGKPYRLDCRRRITTRRLVAISGSGSGFTHSPGFTRFDWLATNS